MWWIAIPVAIGAAAWILDKLSDEAKYERLRWEDKREKVKQDITWHEENIKKHLKDAQNSYDFHLLVDMHYSSVKVADEAYKLLSDVKISLNAIGKALVSAKNERDKLIEERKQYINKTQKENLSKEIDSLASLRKQLFSEKDQIVDQRDDFFNNLKSLNKQTMNLKYLIRDTTGYKGQEWYERLEARKVQRMRNV